MFLAYLVIIIKVQVYWVEFKDLINTAQVLMPFAFLIHVLPHLPYL